MSSNHTCEAKARALAAILVSYGLRCCVAESCTGGLIGATLTALPGSSVWFHGGIIAYSNEVKQALCGVPGAILESFGAVSGQTVEAMARNTARLLGVDVGIAVSGIAGPSGGTPQKPVGLVFIGVHVEPETTVFEHRFIGGRDEVRVNTVLQSLIHTIDTIQKLHAGH